MKYMGEKIKVVSKSGIVQVGKVISYTGKQDTEGGKYDELTIETKDYPYMSFNESEIKSIKVIE